jgi:N,N'-diacetyllegionaminate synthase
MAISPLQIAGRRVGPGEPAYIIAEIGQAHDGSLGTAHAYVDAVARAGADGVKFQTHIARAESTPGEPFRVRVFPQDETRFDYWKRMEFSEAQWVGLAAHAKERGLTFLSTPFSMEAIELLERVGVPAWKIGSGDIGTLPFLRRCAETRRPVLLSSGMSPLEELDAAVTEVRETGARVAVLQCTTAYPCPPEKLGLNAIAELRERYACPVGLSDHSGTPFAGLAAVTLGANLLEVHVCFSRECFGPDVPASITTTELAELVRGVRFIEKALANPVDKRSMARDLAELRTMFGRSVVLCRDLPAGHVLAAGDLAYKKPATGFPASRAHELLGRRLTRSVERDAFIAEADVE